MIDEIREGGVMMTCRKLLMAKQSQRTNLITQPLATKSSCTFTPSMNIFMEKEA